MLSWGVLCVLFRIATNYNRFGYNLCGPANRPAERLQDFGLVIEYKVLTLVNDPQEWRSHNASHEMPVRFSDAADDKIVP